MRRLTCLFRALRHRDGTEAPWSPEPGALLVGVADPTQKGCLQTKETFRSQRRHSRGHGNASRFIEAVVQSGVPLSFIQNGRRGRIRGAVEVIRH